MEKIPSTIHLSWHNYLQPLFDDKRMKYLKYEFLVKEKFLPHPNNIFRVFSMPLSEIKVVILGQDPYPTPGDATGLAFEPGGKKLPASLRIIKTEIFNSNAPMRGSNLDLSDWHSQGVFLLNTALTVRIGKAGSHIKEWKWFTEEIVRIVAENTDAVWILWGAKAQAYEPLIDSTGWRAILKAPHPAAEAYAGGNAGFYGCDHFNKANALLAETKRAQIVW